MAQAPLLKIPGFCLALTKHSYGVFILKCIIYLFYPYSHYPLKYCTATHTHSNLTDHPVEMGGYSVENFSGLVSVSSMLMARDVLENV